MAKNTFQHRMATALCAGTLAAAIGCTADTQPERQGPATSYSYLVSTDEEAGVVARIEYPEIHASVEFKRDVDDELGFVVRYDINGINPTEGLGLEALMPVEAFMRLTGEPAPAELVQAEQEALDSGHELLFDEPTEPVELEAQELVKPEYEGLVDVSAQALTSSRFRDVCGSVNTHICKTNQRGNQAFKSGQRRRAVLVLANALDGNIQVRVRRYRRGWGTKALEPVERGQAIVFATNIGSIRRTLQVKVENAGNSDTGDRYHIGVTWSSTQIGSVGCASDFECR